MLRGDTDTGGDTDTLLDTTVPTANVTTATITTSGSAVVQSTETGTAYLVNTTVTVNNNIVNINGAYDNQKNSVAISLANTDTNLPATGPADGAYKVYAVDTAGNLSNASSNSVTVATTYNPPAPNNFSASGTSNTVTLSWNSVSGALSYTLYWDNVSGIDSSDNAFNNITNDNYTQSGLYNGTTYYYKVTAVDSTGTMGTLSSEVNASTPLPAPDNLSASGANNTITLTWNSVSGATSYTLYWGNVSGIDSSDNAFNNITNDNYTHSSLANGSIYYYKVAAVNSSGTGTLSSVASAILASNIQASKTFNDHTYALTSATMTWNNAKTAATALGGYFTTINTKAENDWLTAIFRIPYGHSWIGANDIATSNTWVWDNGTTSGDSGLTDNLSSNAKWADNTNKWESGEPNGSGASCGYIWKTSGTWDDTPCNNNKYAIIEFD
jgi:fibronectin type 3 domain-containing protein